MKSKVNLNLVREINSSLLLDLLKQKGPMSKYDMSKITGLSAPAVANIICLLLEIGFVKETGIGESVGGRPPLLLELDMEGGFVVGVDIGSDNIAVVLVNFMGEIISKTTTPMDPDDGELQVFDKITATITETIKKSDRGRSKILGIGVGISGDVDTQKGIINHASRLNWTNVPLKSILENSFHIPAFIEENVRLLSFAEKWYGAGRNHDDLVCIRVGDDIGAGIIVDGTFYPGSSGRAGANIGEMRVSDDEDGFLKNRVTSGAILRRMKELCIKDTLIPDNVRDIAIAASEGNSDCLRVMDETGRYLGIAIANILACLDPELVIIGGGIAQAGSVLIDPIKNYLDTFYGEFLKKTKVVQAQLGEEAFSIGAATFVLHRVFAAPREFKR